MSTKIKNDSRGSLAVRCIESALIVFAVLMSIKVKNSSISLIFFILLTTLIYSLKSLAMYLASTMILLDALRLVGFSTADVSTGSYSKTALYFLLFILIRHAQKDKDYAIKEAIQNYWILFAPILIVSTIPILQGPRYILEQLFRGYDNVGHLAIMNSLTNCREFLTHCLDARNAIPTTYNQYPQQWHILFAQDSSSNIPILFWYWIAITSTLLLSVLIVIKSINYSRKKALSQPVSVFRLLTACSLIIVMWSAGYVNYVFSMALLIMGFTLAREKQFNGLILGTAMLTFAMAAYTLFIPAIGIWLALQFLQYSKLGKREFILLLLYTGFFVSYSTLVVFNATKNEQLNALDENSNSWTITIPVLIIIAAIMLKTFDIVQLRKNAEVYGFFFSSIMIQFYLFYQNQLGGYFLYKNVIVLVVLFLLSSMHLKVLTDYAKVALLNFRENFTNLTGYEVTLTGRVKNFGTYTRNSKIYAMVLISVLWTVVPSNAVPSPLQEFASRMKQIADGEMRRGGQILEVVEQTKGTTNPVVYISPDYYFTTQWVAALNGNWSSALQRNLDEIVEKSGLAEIPNLSDVHPGMLTLKATEINHD